MDDFFSKREHLGLKEFRELTALWNLLREGDKILIYTSSPVSGIVGLGTVTTKFRQTNPLWPEEIRKETVLWPLRFEFEIEYCLSPPLWETRAYKETNLQLITRRVFQCVPTSVVDAVRVHFGLLAQETPKALSDDMQLQKKTNIGQISHAEAKSQLVQIGQIQGFLAEEEYPIDSNRLDVVWRRVERSVPTCVFEVQVSGDIYHAVAKLKRAYDLWNSRIFLVADLEQKSKFEELTAGTFHEIGSRARFLELDTVRQLYLRKTEYKLLERRIGILP